MVVGATVGGSVVASMAGSVVGSAGKSVAAGTVAAAFTAFEAAEPNAAITMTLMMRATTPSPRPMPDLALLAILARATALRSITLSIRKLARCADAMCYLRRSDSTDPGRLTDPNLDTRPQKFERMRDR